MDPEAQESVQNDSVTPDGVAEETSSPEVTDGVSSSDTTEETRESLAEKSRDDFLKKYGDADSEDDDSTDEEETEAEQEEEPKVEAEQKQEPPAETDDSEDETRLSDKVFKSLPDGVKKRIGSLNARAKKAERELAELTSKLEETRDSHERLNNLKAFAQQNRMTQEDVATGLSIQAKFTTGDYAGFLRDIMPAVEAARQHVGETFAPDLQDQVDNGYMSEEAARQLTQARLQAKRAAEDATRYKTEAERFSETERQQRTEREIVNAVNAREAELRTSDPDYAQKSPAVKRFMEAALKHGARPTTPQEAVSLVNAAYENAKASVSKPAPKPTPPSPTASTVSRGRPSTPATLEDALAQSPPPAH